jgi:sterol desaturase/sphingolipid hydroxylase (fatty acid hydroxylase superfamily)
METGWYPYLIYWGIGLLFYSAEWLHPARHVPYRTVFLRDLLALGLYSISFLLVVQVTDRIPVPPYAPAVLVASPTLLKLLLFYVVEDFGLYWAHRAMHTQCLWRVHRWHHSPPYLYWLAGIRATIPHIFLFNATYIVALPLLRDASSWAFAFIMVEHIIRNNWMHMNVTWNSSRLEWLIVTPRYHSIHHSRDPLHHRSNLGALFTVWDRLFGTYYDPAKAIAPLAFGIEERVPPLRLVTGL